MIQLQKTAPRKTTSLGPLNAHASIGNDGPTQWGKWSANKHYSLQMVQHPIRARMCGFGDKDRRPLAPAAVARMVVKRPDDTLVDDDDIDISFFVVTVDLWSEDQTQEMNLVLHPSAAERPTPPSRPKISRSRSGIGSRKTANSPYPHSLTPILPHPHPSPTGYSNSPGNPLSYMGSEDIGYQDQAYSVPASHQQSEEMPTWGYPTSREPVAALGDRTTGFPPPALPSIDTFGHSIDANPEHLWHPDTYRTYTQGPMHESGSSTPLGNSWGVPSSSQLTPRLPNDLYTSSLYPFTPTLMPFPQQHLYYDPIPALPFITTPSPLAASSSPTQTQLDNPSKLTYTRTLVGPLSANAYRLLDEHRQPGIFFLFQDLSVRTEGTFRLRLRLMNVGTPREAGANSVQAGVSPVLAQCFTEPFSVYSAKRFPGVPDTTALSVAFGNQGQKLPLRNRHGTGSQGRRRRRRDSDGSEEDST